MNFKRNIANAFLVVYLACLNLFILLTNLGITLFKPKFFWAHLHLIFVHLMRSPYEVGEFRYALLTRRRGISRDELIYGDTPLFTSIYLLWLAGIERGGQFYDLGAGRGGVLMAAKYVGMQSTGYDLNPAHIVLSEGVLRPLDIFLKYGDARNVDASGGNIVYVAWTTWSKHTRHGIERNLHALPSGAKVITLTWGLESDEFVEIRRGFSLFSWGLANYYIFERV